MPAIISTLPRNAAGQPGQAGGGACTGPEYDHDSGWSDAGHSLQRAACCPGPAGLPDCVRRVITPGKIGKFGGKFDPVAGPVRTWKQPYGETHDAPRPA